MRRMAMRMTAASIRLAMLSFQGWCSSWKGRLVDEGDVVRPGEGVSITLEELGVDDISIVENVVRSCVANDRVDG
jgi:hypothetical protein